MKRQHLKWFTYDGTSRDMTSYTKVNMAAVSSVFRAGLFANKVAIVTGGASGIGRAISQELLYLGMVNLWYQITYFCTSK